MASAQPATSKGKQPAGKAKTTKGAGGAKGATPAKRRKPAKPAAAPLVASLSSEEEGGAYTSAISKKLQNKGKRQFAVMGGDSDEQLVVMPVGTINRMLARIDALEKRQSGENSSQSLSEGQSQASSSLQQGSGAAGPSGNSAAAGEVQGEYNSPGDNGAPVSWPWNLATPSGNTEGAQPASFSTPLASSSPASQGEAELPSQPHSRGVENSRVTPGFVQGRDYGTQEKDKGTSFGQREEGRLGVLDEHLAVATIEKILKGEYVDLFTLLYRELDKKEKEDLDAGEKEKLKHRRIERNWSNWFIGYMIYMDVVIKAQPSRGHSMLVYLNTIYRAHTEFSGNGWLHYDEKFRLRAARQPSLRWDEIVAELWMQTLTAARPVYGERAQSGHLVQFSKSFPPPKAQGSQEQQQHPQMCWDYGTQGSCARRPCKYKHICGICWGPHPARYCNKGRGGGTGFKDGANKRGPGNQLAVYKGPQSN